MSFDLRAVIRPEVPALRAYPPVRGPRRAAAGRSWTPTRAPSRWASSCARSWQRRWRQALADVELHRYPDPEARELRPLLARDLGVAPEQIVATNGSDEAIQILLVATAAAGGRCRWRPRPRLRCTS